VSACPGINAAASASDGSVLYRAEIYSCAACGRGASAAKVGRTLGAHVTPGAHVAKGDEIGRFQFGGSTACLIFGPDVVQDVALPAIPRPGATPVRVNSRLLTVRGSPSEGVDHGEATDFVMPGAFHKMLRR
jgi:hypothetical protein